MDDIYCEKCGCEIRCIADLGCREPYIERVPGALIGQYEDVERDLVLCRSCMDEEERTGDEFKKMVQDQYEFSF